MSATKELLVSYDTYKSVTLSLTRYYVQFNDRYLLVSGSDSMGYVCRITDPDEIADFVANIKPFATQVESKKDAYALASIANKTNKVAPRTSDGKQQVTIWPTEGAKANFITPNWCDRTTWYYRAVRVVDEVISPKVAGVYTTYKASHVNFIDSYHGKLTAEDYLQDAQGNSYRAVVKVNDAVKVEQDPHVGSGGDYTVDYALGEVTFLSALTANDQVKVTYHYENGSEWVLRPEPGKILKIKTVEVQFSTDIVLTDSVVFQPYGPVDVRAPGLTPDPYPPGTMLPLGNPDVYKTMLDYVNDSNGSYVTLPKMGGPGWRGMVEAAQIFRWDYQAVTDMVASKGVETRIKLAHDIPFQGWMATATFYCLSVSE